MKMKKQDNRNCVNGYANVDVDKRENFCGVCAISVVELEE